MSSEAITRELRAVIGYQADADAQSGRTYGQARYAGLLAEAEAGGLLHVAGIGWHYWDGARWAEDTGEKRAVRKVMGLIRRQWNKINGDKGLVAEWRSVNSSSGVRGVLSLAAADPRLSADVDELDTDPYLLNCANGTLDLRTLQLREHDPADRITKVTAAAYDPAAGSPEWESFLKQALPDPAVRNYLRRLIGLALIGKVVEHELHVAIGTGRNGKGTFYSAVERALGDYAGHAESGLFMASHRERDAPQPGLVALRGKRFVVASEPIAADRSPRRTSRTSPAATRSLRARSTRRRSRSSRRTRCCW